MGGKGRGGGGKVGAGAVGERGLLMVGSGGSAATAPGAAAA